jgi:hypothetical protein
MSGAARPVVPVVLDALPLSSAMAEVIAFEGAVMLRIVMGDIGGPLVGARLFWDAKTADQLRALADLGQAEFQRGKVDAA